MAKIVEDIVIIRFSKIVMDGDDQAPVIAGGDVQSALEQVAQELVGDSIVVEVVKS